MERWWRWWRERFDQRLRAWKGFASPFWVLLSSVIVLIISLVWWLGLFEYLLMGLPVAFLAGIIKPVSQRGVHVETRTVEFLFATNRKRIDDVPHPRFSHEETLTLSFGAIHLHVPEDHEEGRLELPSKLRLFKMRIGGQADAVRKKFFIIESVEIFDTQQRFVDLVRESETNTALIFVHGFNTKFYEAVYRFAQILWDAKFRGLPILFSWPSRGGFYNYDSDEKAALASCVRFSELLGLIQQVPAIDTLHVIAHSMGNQVVLEGLDRLALAAPQSSVRLSEVIMASPDVDRRIYKDRTPRVRKIARGMTLYASSRDKALKASGWKTRDSTAGGIRNGRPIPSPGVDAIDVSALGATPFGLNHNMFAKDRELLKDIGVLLHEERRPPHERNGLMKGVPNGADPPDYWRFVAIGIPSRWTRFRHWCWRWVAATAAPRP